MLRDGLRHPSLSHRVGPDVEILPVWIAAPLASEP
jgi:hypothetical protein